eukprot:scaffold1305_cov248-Pinguiococcus_pyrenoidosus.AAC.2
MKNATVHKGREHRPMEGASSLHQQPVLQIRPMTASELALIGPACGAFESIEPVTYASARSRESPWMLDRSGLISRSSLDAATSWTRWTAAGLGQRRGFHGLLHRGRCWKSVEFRGRQPRRKALKAPSDPCLRMFLRSKSLDQDWAPVSNNSSLFYWGSL